MQRWSLDSIPWDLFEGGQIDVHSLCQARGASLVEANAADYALYLHQVFKGEENIHADIDLWAEDEQRHGAVLRRWCEMADPTFDYEASMSRFRRAFHLPSGEQGSVRGSRAQELVSRCVIETGTATYYAALRDYTHEPVLKEICRRIAGDEVRHFNLFLKYLNGRCQISRLARVRTILERIFEAEDQELTFAYFAANDGEDFDPSRFEEYSKRYMEEAVGIYKFRHFKMAAPMLGRAAGLTFRPWFSSLVGSLVYGTFQARYA